MNTPTTLRRAGRPSVFLLGLGAAAALAVACGSSSGGGGTAAGGGSSGGGGGGAYGAAAPGSTAPGSTAPGSTTPAGQATAMTTRTTSLGTVLVGPDGRTAYLFEKDTGPMSTCSGACSAVWPAITTTAHPMAAGAVQAKLLGTTSRSDGTTQVTYAGHPLYYFAGDKAPGDVRGEGLKDFGAGWYVLMPNGQKIDRD